MKMLGWPMASAISWAKSVPQRLKPIALDTAITAYLKIGLGDRPWRFVAVLRNGQERSRSSAKSMPMNEAPGCGSQLTKRFMRMFITMPSDRKTKMTEEPP